MPDCRYWQGLLAEHALASARRSATGPAMPDDLAEHLVGCQDCQTAAAEFRATAAALASTSAPTRAPSAPPTPAGLTLRIATRVDHERQRRDRRRRLVAVSAAAALIVVGVWAVAVRGPGSTETAGERVTLSAAGLHGDATLRAETWGTQIEINASGFTPGQRYLVWLERADGSRVGAGSFMGVRSHEITAVLASDLASAEAVAIGISDPDGRVLVRAELE